MSGVPHPFAGPLKQNGKTCSLVRETTKVSEECFLEPECGEECKTVDERKCSTVQEQQCRKVQEQQCDVIQVRREADKRIRTQSDILAYLSLYIFLTISAGGAVHYSTGAEVPDKD